MYRTLFALAGLGIVAWLPLILLPGWRVTRWLAETAVMPVFLSVLYAIGITAVLLELGPGIVRDFGHADGVRALLQTEGLALVAWIHILAFDQIVGLLIYRDNMRHRFLALPAQSIVLLLTLMFGPVGFLAYYASRVSKRRSGRVAWGEAAATAAPVRTAPPASLRFADVKTRSITATLLALWKRERLVVACGLLAFLLGGACLAVAAAKGSWHVPPEGRLLDAVKFEVGVGIYFVTLALLLPFAGLSERGRRWWVAWTVGNGLYFMPIEAVQAIRGLDPRFTRAGSVLDQTAGALFGVSAIVTIALFALLGRRFFTRDVLRDQSSLRLGIRYGVAAIVFAFGSGLAMSVMQTRVVMGSGTLMPIHAAGFHGIQAVPVVALLLAWSPWTASARHRLTHAAGVAWLALCSGLLWQALAGVPPLALSAATALAAAGFGAWVICFVVAMAEYVRRKGALDGGRPSPGPAAVSLPSDSSRP
ncbi:MAG TPA: ABA4-like family protein [Vicinamibacterales bacterium]|nr:ABA4-like family protein [Vicinamibacterales bacterium]